MLWLHKKSAGIFVTRVREGALIFAMAKTGFLSNNTLLYMLIFYEINLRPLIKLKKGLVCDGQNYPDFDTMYL